MDVTYEEIVKAKAVQGDFLLKTPLIYSQTFSEMTGSEVFLKSEYYQRTGSFKIRGAYYKIKTLTEEERKKGVVAASAGNHGQGVALAASVEKIPCTIVMPKTASPAKVSATKGYGATVVLAGASYDESWKKAQEIATETGAKIIHAFDDPQIIAAQGVVGLEVMEQISEIDEVYVPIGGGGLASGIALAIKTKHPNVRIIGVQSKSFPSMKESFDKKSITTVKGGKTIADGISVKTPGNITFEMVKNLVDDVVLVDDAQIIEAMFLLMERKKAIVEPAGAASLAYLLSNKPAPGKKVVVILAGGNVDMYLLGQIVDKGLAFMGRLLKISILLPDRPGALKDVVDVITESDANIVEVVHDRFSLNIDAGAVGVVLSLETHGRDTAQKLVEHLREKGIQFKMMT